MIRGKGYKNIITYKGYARVISFDNIQTRFVLYVIPFDSRLDSVDVHFLPWAWSDPQPDNTIFEIRSTADHIRRQEANTNELLQILNICKLVIYYIILNKICQPQYRGAATGSLWMLRHDYRKERKEEDVRQSSKAPQYAYR